MTLAKKLAAAVIAFAVALAVWAVFVEPARLVVEERTLALPSLPPALDGLRVAVLADLHAGAPHMDLSRVEEIVARTRALDPDVVLIPGDVAITGVLGGTPIPHADVARALGALEAPTFAVLGNHDVWADGAAIERALEDAGIPVLTDRVARAETRLGPVWIAGFGDLWTQRPRPEGTVAQVPEGEPVIAFTHNPDLFAGVPSRVVLTVAGHTHGGQVSLPFYGPLWIPSELGTRYAAGHIVEDEKHLFVSTGLGTSILPIRFNVPPSLPLLVLRR